MSETLLNLLGWVMIILLFALPIMLAMTMTDPPVRPVINDMVFIGSAHRISGDLERLNPSHLFRCIFVIEGDGGRLFLPPDMEMQRIFITDSVDRIPAARQRLLSPGPAMEVEMTKPLFVISDAAEKR